MSRRTASLCASAIAALLTFTGCDSGDGKQLQPYDPSDYPSQTATSTVASTVTDDEIDAGASTPGAPSTTVVAPEGTIEPFALAAPWVDGADIDPRYTCDGLDQSPALSWGAVPAGTVEIAIALVDESSVSNGQPFVHWVIGGLDPAEIAVVEGDVPTGAIQALNFFGDVGYGGPCPPPGDTAHLYRLTAYALNQQLELADGSLATDFLATIATITLASADVTGMYQR